VTLTKDAPLYERDPEAWQAHLAEGNARRARKRVSADVLLRDATGRVLIVNPGYKPGWDTPGGMVEANERPDDAVRRELREELGVDVQVGALLVVDWVPPHSPWDDMIAFVFDGGELTDAQVAGLRLADHELSGWEFCAPAEAVQRLSERTGRRLVAALSALSTGQARYLVDGV
jgi:8-oxo-dGTP diphosphatase